MRRLIVTLWLSLACLAGAFAQEYRPGFIIKLNGDSVAGLVNYRNDKFSAEACHFKESGKRVKIIYHPGEIMGYGFIDDKYYETRTLPPGFFQSKTIFVELLMKGKMNLLKSDGVFLVETDSIYVLVNSSRTVEVEGRAYLKEDKKYVGILNYLMLDCGLKADQTAYEDRDLTNLIRNYNQCRQAQIVEYKAKIPWTRVKYTVFGSADFSSISLGDYSDYKFMSSNSFIGGVGINLSSPRIHDKAFLCVEMWYVKKLYQGYYEKTALTGITRSDFTMNASFLKIPVGVGYNFLRNGNTPYFKLGLAEYFWLNKPTAVIINETESQGVVVTDKTEQPLSTRATTGIWVAAGYTQTTESRFSGFVEIRYESSIGYFTAVNQSSSSTQNYNLIVGVKF